MNVLQLPQIHLRYIPVQDHNIGVLPLPEAPLFLFQKQGIGPMAGIHLQDVYKRQVTISFLLSCIAHIPLGTRIQGLFPFFFMGNTLFLLIFDLAIAHLFYEAAQVQ